ncbi:P-loop containing nucleoside triphosphate hydrolase protein, partial [Polychytrium aggregatum]|uniref:P-loop containing nucleoside triphosphate hydrolase protein n=1 Tax=Polychytrium aggregatum TaxID=110093 RepID=UPI0022FDE726
NKLQNVFASLAYSHSIDLPQIVVVGSQSSGKSSVLENIVGRDFLPRGDGMVTRCPLVLQLVNLPEAYAQERAEILYPEKIVFSDISQVQSKILEITSNKLSGKYHVSKEPINIKISSPHVPTLTLVDLPGVISARRADQPADIEEQIRDMIMHFISKENTVILAVSAANVDLANSAGIQLAQKVDPKGERTIGVLTKVDLMDRGTDVVSFMRNSQINLTLGYIPVVNRCQQDINEKKSIEQALAAEREFFRSKYPGLVNKCGTEFLSKRLSEILKKHIKKTLPAIKQKITNDLSLHKKLLQDERLSQISDGVDNLVSNEIEEFHRSFQEVLDGTDIEDQFIELKGGAKILGIINQIYRESIQIIDALDGTSDEEIRVGIKKASGMTEDMIFNQRAFEIFARKAVQKLKRPCTELVDMIHIELLNIAEEILEDKSRLLCSRFPLFKLKFQEVVTEFLQNAMNSAQAFVYDIISAEGAYVNMSHPRLQRKHQDLFTQPWVVANEISQAETIPDNTDEQSHFSISQDPKFLQKDLNSIQGPLRIIPGSLSEREKYRVQLLKEVLNVYFEIIKEQITDQVHKAIMYKLVIFAKVHIYRELNVKLYKVPEISDLLQEQDHIVEERARIQLMIDTLKEANDVINGIV